MFLTNRTKSVSCGNGADKGRYILRVQYAMMALTLLVVILRFLSRLLAKLPLLWDD